MSMFWRLLDGVLALVLPPPPQPEPPTITPPLPAKKPEITEADLRLGVHKIAQSSDDLAHGTMAESEQENQGRESWLNENHIRAIVEESIAGGLCLSVMRMIEGQTKPATHYIKPIECRAVFFRATNLATGRDASFGFTGVKMIIFAKFDFLEEIAGSKNIRLRNK